MDEDMIRLCIAALWENSIDGRLADYRYNSDFSQQEKELTDSFLEYLARQFEKTDD